MTFGRRNYTVMLIGLGLIALGYTVMSMEDATYGFGAKGLTVGPLLLVAGFITELVAIMIKPDKVRRDNSEVANNQL